MARSESYPYGEMDAVRWAEEFVELYPMVDMQTMTGWFANAIMTGYYKAQNEQAGRNMLRVPVETEGW